MIKAQPPSQEQQIINDLQAELQECRSKIQALTVKLDGETKWRKHWFYRGVAAENKCHQLEAQVTRLTKKLLQRSRLIGQARTALNEAKTKPKLPTPVVTSGCMDCDWQEKVPTVTIATDLLVWHSFENPGHRAIVSTARDGWHRKFGPTLAEE